MSSPDGQRRITIIGTGLIGGSIGLALKAAKLPGIEVIGHDRDRGTAAQAEKMGAIDHAEHNLPHAVREAGMVIIATPLLTVREVMQQVAPDLEEGAVVTDTASTKAQVMRWARETLPSGVSFVGGHPMAGKETAGIQHADAALFRDKAYCVCPSIDAPESAVKSVMGLASLAGAEPLFIDPEEHDTYAAAVSHLTLMISTALFNLMRSSPAWPDLGPMASSGFRDATRLASTDPALSHGVWVTNREAIIHWLERMSGELMRFRDLLQDAQDEALLETFTRVTLEREVFLDKPPRRERPPEEKPETQQTLLTLLVGGMMAKNVKRMREMAEKAKERQLEQVTPEGGRRKITVSEKIAEDVRRDLDKLERKRAEKARKKEARGKGDG